MRLELTLVEALCGFQKTIHTLDERDLVITSLPGEVVKHGDVKCVLNEGMPHYRNPFEKGRLIIQFHVVFPQQLPPEIVPQLEPLLPSRYNLENISFFNQYQYLIKIFVYCRPEVIISDQAEEVMLMDFNPETDSRRQRDQREAYADDDDHHHGPRGPGGVQCATQ